MEGASDDYLDDMLRTWEESHKEGDRIREQIEVMKKENEKLKNEKLRLAELIKSKYILRIYNHKILT